MSKEEDEDGVGTEDEIVEDDEEIRCICGFTDDDGNTIACDKCGVWQHMVCVGVDHRHVPDVYFCDACDPRELDVAGAVELQKRRRERKNKGKGRGGGNRKDGQEKTSPKKRKEGDKADSRVEKQGRNRIKVRAKPSNIVNASPPEVRRRRKGRPTVTGTVGTPQSNRNGHLKTDEDESDAPKPGTAYEAEYYSHSSKFGELSFPRFASTHIGTHIEQVWSDWRQSEQFKSRRESNTDLDAGALVPLSVDWLLDQIPLAVWDPLPPNPVSGVRRFALFATVDIPANTYVTDIKGALSGKENLEKAKGLDLLEVDNCVLAPPFVFAHPAHAVRLGDQPLAVDAREWGERGGRYVRYWCGGDDAMSSKCNAHLRSVTVYEENDDETDEPSVEDGSGLTLNEKIILAIFTTKRVGPAEEIVLGKGATGWIGYPCICEDLDACLVAKGVELHERIINGEPEETLLKAGRRRRKSGSRKGKNGQDFRSEDEVEEDREERVVPDIPATPDNQTHDGELDLFAASSSGKRLSREEKKLQDQLARIERMEREAQQKRMRQEKRARTKSGGTSVDEAEQPREAESLNRKRRRDNADGTVEVSEPREMRQTEHLTSGALKRQKGSPDLPSPSAMPRRGGFKAWIFAQEEAREAKAKEEEVEADRAAQAARDEIERSFDEPATEEVMHEPENKKRKLSESPPPLRVEGANNEGFSGSKRQKVEVPETSDASVDTVAVNPSAAPSKQSLDNEIAKGQTLSSTSSSPDISATPAATPGVIRKVSLQEFMAKKRLMASSAPSTPSIPESTIGGSSVLQEYPFPKMDKSNEEAVNKSAGLGISFPEGKLDDTESLTRQVTIEHVTVCEQRAVSSSKSDDVMTSELSSSLASESRSDGQFPKFPTSGLASIFGVQKEVGVKALSVVTEISDRLNSGNGLEQRANNSSAAATAFADKPELEGSFEGRATISEHERTRKRGMSPPLPPSTPHIASSTVQGPHPVPRSPPQLQSPPAPSSLKSPAKSVNTPAYQPGMYSTYHPPSAPPPPPPPYPSRRPSYPGYGGYSGYYAPDRGHPPLERMDRPPPPNERPPPPHMDGIAGGYSCRPPPHHYRRPGPPPRFSQAPREYYDRHVAHPGPKSGINSVGGPQSMLSGYDYDRERDPERERERLDWERGRERDWDRREWERDQNRSRDWERELWERERQRDVRNSKAPGREYEDNRMYDRERERERLPPPPPPPPLRKDRGGSVTPSGAWMDDGRISSLHTSDASREPTISPRSARPLPAPSPVPDSASRRRSSGFASPRESGIEKQADYAPLDNGRRHSLTKSVEGACIEADVSTPYDPEHPSDGDNLEGRRRTKSPRRRGSSLEGIKTKAESSSLNGQERGHDDWLGASVVPNHDVRSRSGTPRSRTPVSRHSRSRSRSRPRRESESNANISYTATLQSSIHSRTMSRSPSASRSQKDGSTPRSRSRTRTIGSGGSRDGSMEGTRKSERYDGEERERNEHFSRPPSAGYRPPASTYRPEYRSSATYRSEYPPERSYRPDQDGDREKERDRGRDPREQRYDRESTTPTLHSPSGSFGSDRGGVIDLTMGGEESERLNGTP
ncbi:hypothetical protein SpCBS45565_g04607 [Spizellomyces sp. 'palustris']|nr:hypothetical protein SpCBS45565_g04607 [Spizellomyces sp. 'palustris']